MNTTDSIWLKQLTQYDDSGVKSLFEQYYIPLVLFSKSYVYDLDIARDLVQDVFLALIQTREKFTSINNLKTYLYSAVKNQSMKYIRHEKVKMRYSYYVLENNREDEEDIDRILEEEVFVLLKKSIEELPEQCRKVFQLALSGKKNTEIAIALGIGVETVKSHKKAGKQILFGKLRNYMSILSFFYFYKRYLN